MTGISLQRYEGKTSAAAGLFNIVRTLFSSLPVVVCSLLAFLMLHACATTPGPEDVKKAEAFYKLGVAYLNNGRLNDAYVEFQKALKYDPRSKETLNYLGYVSANFNRYDDAISYYRRAIDVDPSYSEAMNNLGVVYLELGRWDQAIECFRGALDNPTYSTPEKSYSSLGYAYYRKGEYRRAEEFLKEALMRNPDFPLAMYNLGLVYIGMNRVEDAVDILRKTIAVVPDYMDAHLALGKLYMKAGDRSRALKHFGIVVREDTDAGRRREASEYLDRLKY